MMKIAYSGLGILRHFAVMLIIATVWQPTAFGQQAIPAGDGNTAHPPGAAPVFKICEPPPVCFASVEARRAWAEQHQCRFLEDVCSQTTPERDNKGAPEEGRGFWGDLWQGIEGGLVYGYEFVEGLLTGLKNQLADLYSLIVDADDAIAGLIDLGRAFYDDPEGTLQTSAGLLGQDAIDNITRATHCGAYDLGLVIGQNVSPAVMLRLASRLSQYGGDLAHAVHATRQDFGCSSFAAGTPILTGRGRVAIERIGAGDSVLSRDEGSLSDKPQAVTRVFSRTAPGYRLLRTEFDTFRVTDEHPLWVQGKGWTQAKDVTDEDVISGRDGDTLVLSNQAVRHPLQVFNFSVAVTPSYCVGEGGSWVHNAKCRTVPGGGLAAHEAAGGHLLVKHVGRTERQLRERFESEPDLNFSSSFNDRAPAEYAVSETLNAHLGLIDAFLKGSGKQLVLDHTLPKVAGVSAVRGESGLLQVSKVRLILRKKSSMQAGYLILTGYPNP